MGRVEVKSLNLWNCIMTNENKGQGRIVDTDLNAWAIIYASHVHLAESCIRNRAAGT